MVITATEISPIVALIAGVLILIVPRLLNIIVAIYLIIEGLVGLNAVHHFFRSTGLSVLPSGCINRPELQFRSSECMTSWPSL